MPEDNSIFLGMDEDGELIFDLNSLVRKIEKDNGWEISDD